MSFDDRLRSRMQALRAQAPGADAVLSGVAGRARRRALRQRLAAGGAAACILVAAVVLVGRSPELDEHQIIASPAPAEPASELRECTADDVEGTIRTDKPHYDVGEQVVVTAEVVNRSGGDCAPLRVRSFAIHDSAGDVVVQEFTECVDPCEPWRDGETVSLRYGWRQALLEDGQTHVHEITGPAGTSSSEGSSAGPGTYRAVVSLQPARIATLPTLETTFQIVGPAPAPDPAPATPEPTPESYPECEPAEVSRTTATDKQRYGPGEDVLIIGEATNAGSRSCRFPGGHVVGIYDEEGTHLAGMAISGSCLAPCGPWEPGATMRSTATWGQQLSGDDPGSAPPGRYRASMTYAEITQDVWFEIEASGSPAPSGNSAGS